MKVLNYLGWLSFHVMIFTKLRNEDVVQISLANSFTGGSTRKMDKNLNGVGDSGGNSFELF